MKIAGFLATAACLFLPAISLAADPPADLPKELVPLHRFAGKWEKEFEVTIPGQTPEKVKRTGTHASEWILNNRHLQEKGKDSDGTVYLMVTSYDAEGKQFKSTFFQSTGFTSTMTGTFDAATSTFTFRNPTGGGEFAGTNQFIDADTQKLHFELKGPDGKLLFKLIGTGKRVKE